MSEEQNRLAKAVLDLRSENDRLRAELRKKKERRNVDRPECRTFDGAWKAFERASVGCWAADWDAAFVKWLFEPAEGGAV